MTQKTKNIIYWITTLWLALGMFSTGLVQLLKMKEEVGKISTLGYPTYFLTLLGIWKILGVFTILIPKFRIVKEWAYAGFFFSMSGAIFSHIVSKSAMAEIFPSLLLLVLTILSWYFRPAERKLNLVNL